MPSGGNKAQKAILASRSKSRSQVIDLSVIGKGVICGVCMPNIKSLSLTVKKLQRRLKLTIYKNVHVQTERQIDKQTDRQKGHKQHSIRGHKIIRHAYHGLCRNGNLIKG